MLFFGRKVLATEREITACNVTKFTHLMPTHCI